MRVLGLDLGSRRIGVAVSDPDGRIATPVEVVARSGDHAADRRRLVALAGEWEAECIVVGLPFSLDGSLGPAAELALAEVAALRSETAIPVETVDERFTTVTASQALREAGVPGRRSRRVIDAVAAAVLLQSWLDARHTAESQGDTNGGN